MKKRIGRFASLLLLTTVILTLIQCDKKATNNDDPPAGDGTVTINLTLPLDLSGRTWFIGFGNNLGGIFVYEQTGICGVGTTITITLNDAPVGTYYLAAIVYVASAIPGAPQAGDYVGVFGLDEGSDPGELVAPNAIVPETGDVTFDIDLFLM